MISSTTLIQTLNPTTTRPPHQSSMPAEEKDLKLVKRLYISNGQVGRRISAKEIKSQRRRRDRDRVRVILGEMGMNRLICYLGRLLGMSLVSPSFFYFYFPPTPSPTRTYFSFLFRRKRTRNEDDKLGYKRREART